LFEVSVVYGYFTVSKIPCLYRSGKVYSMQLYFVEIGI
jgi:hypothetical protein